MRGRKPHPTERKRLEGNPGRRPMNEHEPAIPAPDPAFDVPPLVLANDGVAQEEWRRLAPMLRQSRTVTVADTGVLIAACQQWSRYLAATAQVVNTPMVVRSPSGYPMPNPYIAIANKALTHLVKLWAELGLTPSSRSRVQTAGSGPGPAGDAFTEFDHPLPRTH